MLAILYQQRKTMPQATKTYLTFEVRCEMGSFCQEVAPKCGSRKDLTKIVKPSRVKFDATANQKADTMWLAPTNGDERVATSQPGRATLRHLFQIANRTRRQARQCTGGSSPSNLTENKIAKYRTCEFTNDTQRKPLVIWRLIPSQSI